MPHKIGFVDNSNGQLAHYNMLAQLRHFCGGFGDIGSITRSGTGNGTISGVEASPSAVTETWTITCTIAAANGGTFSVVGSVSGAQADAVVGTPYENGLIKFLISDGSTDFTVGATISIPVTQGAASAAGAVWEVLRYDTVSDNRQLILKGAGYTGEEEIFVGFRTYQSEPADYYNLVAAAFTGYVPSNTFDTQPGARLSGVPAHNNRIDYWLTLNPQRIALAMKVGTPVYESCYLGKFLPYARPSQYPYPVIAAGMFTGAPATRFSDTSHSIPYKGARANMAMRFNDGTWRTPASWPWNNTRIAGSSSRQRDTGGHYPLNAVVLSDSLGIYGELDGIRHITGFDNAVENTLVVDGKTWLVVQDVWRTGFNDYYALRMD